MANNVVSGIRCKQIIDDFDKTRYIIIVQSSRMDFLRV